MLLNMSDAPATFDGVRGNVTVGTDHSLEGSSVEGALTLGPGAAPSSRDERVGRQLLSGRAAAPPAAPALPAVHDAGPGTHGPLLALARRLVERGHTVIFFTTAHYRDKVEATGATFVPFAPEYDAHDLMVANPERESSAKRGVRGVKDDLRRIFIGPLPGQCRDLRAILAALRPPTASSSTPCSSGPCRSPSVRVRHARARLCRRHALRVVQPRHGALRRRFPAGVRACCTGCATAP